MPFNKAELLKRGWTRTSIKRILGEPDRRLPMRRFRHDRPECAYDDHRVFVAEEAGAVRYRKAGDRCMPGPRTPGELAQEMLRAGSARARRRVVMAWAEKEGMVSRQDPPQTRRAQWDNVLALFIEEENM